MTDTQTTDAINAENGMIEISTNGTVWNDLSGSIVSVNNGAQKRNTGQVTTIFGTAPIVMVGKKQAMEVTIRLVFTSTADEAFDVLQGIWDTTPPTVYLRESPEGLVASKPRYTSGKGYISSFQYPSIDSGSVDPITVEVVCTIPSYTESTIGTADV